MAKRKHDLIEPITVNGEEIKSVTISVTGNKLVAFEKDVMGEGETATEIALHMIQMLTDLPEDAAGELDFEDIQAVNALIEEILPSPAPTDAAPDGAEASSPTAPQS